MPVVITQEEKALPYAKYFYQDLAPIPRRSWTSGTAPWPTRPWPPRWNAATTF